MNTRSILIPYLCLGGLISAPVSADADVNSTLADTPYAEIHAAEAMTGDRHATESRAMTGDRHATESRGEVRTNAYWDEEEEVSLADEVVEAKASYDPTDDASSAELQPDEQEMPVQRRFREEITVEEIRPDD